MNKNRTYLYFKGILNDEIDKNTSFDFNNLMCIMNKNAN